MNAHDVYLEWVHLVNKGVREAKFNILSNVEVKRLRSYESKYIQRAKIWIENGYTLIRML